MAEQKQRIPVNSSNIKSLFYDEAKKELEVEFYGKPTSGPTKIYSYTPITLQCFKELRDSDSVGAYFSTHIRSNVNVTVTQIK